MNSIENNFFKRAISEYCNDYIRNNDMSLCQVKLRSDDECAKMLAICMKNIKPDSFIIDHVAREFGDDEKQHDKYSPGICIKYDSEPLDLIMIFIISFTGDAYLLTNNYCFGYTMMVTLIFGGESNFQSCCKIENVEITSNQGDIIPFINGIDEMG